MADIAAKIMADKAAADAAAGIDPNQTGADAAAEEGDSKHEHKQVGGQMSFDMLTPERNGWIMLSHDETNKHFADDIYEQLSERGWKCWIRHKEKPVPRMPNEDMMVFGKGIEGAGVIIPLLCKNYEEDAMCFAELNMALLNRVPVIGLICERGYKPERNGWVSKAVRNQQCIDCTLGTRNASVGILAALFGEDLIKHIIDIKDKVELEEHPDDLQKDVQLSEDNCVLGVRVRRGPDWAKTVPKWPGWTADEIPGRVGIETYGTVLRAVITGESPSEHDDMKVVVSWDQDMNRTWTYSMGAKWQGVEQYHLMLESGLTEEELWGNSDDEEEEKSDSEGGSEEESDDEKDDEEDDEDEEG
jgi:hypothetical protein